MSDRIRIGDAEIACSEKGSGRPVIFLHAFPLSRRMWDDQIDALSGGHRVVCFDWRGFGESSLGGGIGTLDRFADDTAALMDHLSIPKATICGLSMGGYAAFALFRRHRDRIERLILADTRATADTDEARRGRIETAAAVRSSGVEAIVETMIPRLIGETSLNSRPQVSDKLGRIIRSNSPESVAQALLAMASRPDSSDLLARIDVPTLIIVGNEDKLTPPAEAETMHRGIAGSRFELIQGAGHLPNMETPGEFNRAVADFINSGS